MANSQGEQACSLSATLDKAVALEGNVGCGSGTLDKHRCKKLDFRIPCNLRLAAGF